MSVFPKLILEDTVQVNDKTRLNAQSSFASAGYVFAKVEINPDTDNESYIDVTSDYYLDWQYADDSEAVTVGLKITDTLDNEYEITKTIVVVSESDDALLSNDNDLIPYENDILTFIRDGRSSFNDIHREAKEMIIRWFEERGHLNSDNTPLTLSDFSNPDQLRSWSKFMVLRLIFESQSNQVDDVFAAKALKYKALEENAKALCSVTIDGDYGEVSLNINTITMVRG